MELQPIVSVKDLQKTYVMGEVEVRALRGINLDIYEAEFLAIMGASGSGKSTFMNILGCLDVPTSGKYSLDQVDVSTLDRDQLAKLRNEKIGFVFQAFNLLPRTSALENVELPLMYNRHLTAKEIRERAYEALSIVGLKERADHMPNQLSGGQQQRVAIARSLVNEPKIILADEPTGNLDTHTSGEVMEVFQNLNDEGKTVILVTHETDISEYAKQVVEFRDGQIEKHYDIEKRRIAVAN